MKATAITTAESILEPFWDPELCAIDRWTVNGNAETGTELAQGWCNVIFRMAELEGSGASARHIQAL
ncbi:MAG: hypothetical protein ACLR23_15415 [Clostridia bacterium]